MNDKIIAKENIEILFREANKIKDLNLATDYVKKARKIAMRLNIRIPKEFKRRFCKHCNTYLVPGKNVRIRNNKSSITYYCLNCKKFMRFPLK